MTPVPSALSLAGGRFQEPSSPIPGSSLPIRRWALGWLRHHRSGGGYTNRPNVVANKIQYPKHQHEWVNPAAFAAPTPVWAGGVNQGFGNTRKDAVVGPGRLNFNTSFYKTFIIKEGIDFKFRVETFNTFNHTEWNGVSSTFGSGNFGSITSTWDPRVLELGAELHF